MKFSTLVLSVTLLALSVPAYAACNEGQSWQDCRFYEQQRQQNDAFFDSQMSRLDQSRHDQSVFQSEHPDADTSLWPHVTSYPR
jgi:hypothetical protein